jgi:hypothetical protein
MFCSPTITPTARVEHKCTSCAEPILKGEKYLKWASFDDGATCTNKMHVECYDAHDAQAKEWGERMWEYRKYDYKRGSAEEN